VQQRDLFESAQPLVYTVGQITQSLRRVIHQSFGEVVVEGELSNTKRHSSGHWYLTLKDESAQLGAVFFRREAASLRFHPEDGMRVRATGTLDVYAPQGRYQLLVRRLEPVGQGALELAFRQLCERLRREGLFEAGRKKPLPRIPQHIALVTSPTGAAVRDMLTTLARRWPVVRVSVVPVQVQGEQAPRDIVRALQFLDRHAEVDVIVLGRGGGSLEDLWAFNEEAVARAIAALHIPIVSGVGHEVDTTIADLVADARAATPTAAAAMVVPDRQEVHTWLQGVQRRLATALRRRSEQQATRLRSLLRSYGLRRPQLLIADFRRRLDERQERLGRAVHRLFEQRRDRQQGLAAQLRTLSPRGVLERGYTYCVDATSGHVVARADATHDDQDVRLHFADGVMPARMRPASNGSPRAKGTA
jgi:exodeoxyribonuclease VII large subunit